MKSFMPQNSCPKRDDEVVDIFDGSCEWHLDGFFCPVLLLFSEM